MGFQFFRRQIARRVFGLGYFTSVEYFISRHHALYIGTLYTVSNWLHIVTRVATPSRARFVLTPFTKRKNNGRV